jgi:hypothetical protein
MSKNELVVLPGDLLNKVIAAKSPVPHQENNQNEVRRIQGI